MTGIQSLVSNLLMDLRNLLSLFRVVFAALCFSGQFTLFASQFLPVSAECPGVVILLSV